MTNTILTPNEANEKLQKLRALYGVVVEKLRARGGVCDNAKHFTWEPTATEAGTPYQHIRYGPWGVADTYHSDPIPGVPGSIFADTCPAKAGDKQLADLIVGLLRWFPDTFDVKEEPPKAIACPLCQEEVAEENISFRISELERKVSVIDKFLLQQESAEADPRWWRLRRWWRK